MRKGYNFTELSDRKCAVTNCRKMIKARLVDDTAHGGKSRPPELCYGHFREATKQGVDRRTCRTHLGYLLVTSGRYRQK